MIALGLANTGSRLEEFNRRGGDERLDQILSRSDVPSGWNGREMGLMCEETFRNHSI